METITERFIKVRNILHLNKSQLAEKIGKSPSVIGDIESGRVEPSRSVITTLLELYNVNINWLFTGNGEMFVNGTEEKKEVETVGDRLKFYREKSKQPLEKFAIKMGVVEADILEYESNKKEIPIPVKVKLVGNGLDLGWLETGEGNMYKSGSITLLGDLPNKTKETEKIIESNAGNKLVISQVKNKEENINSEDFKTSFTKYVLADSSPADSENTQKNIELVKVINGVQKSNYAILIPEELRKYEGRFIAAIINSDDMEPTIKKSSIVLCDVLGFRGAGIYIVKINNVYMIKRVFIKPDVYVFVCDNKLYESFEMPIESDKVKIGGQVKSVTNIMY